MNKKVIGQIAGMLKLDAEVLAQGLSQEDGEIELPKGTFFTDVDLTTLKDNHGKERYDAGATASREMLLKEISKEAGLETIKDKNEFLKAYQAKILKEANVEPEKKVSELEASLEKLRTDLTEKDKSIEQLKSQYSQKETAFKVEGLIPELPETIGLTKQEARDLFFLQHEIKEDGIYRNGQKLKDAMEGALDLDKAVQSYVSEKGWDKKAPAGRGGGAGGQSSDTPTTLAEYESHIKEKGFHPGSREAQAVLAKVVGANPEIEI